MDVRLWETVAEPGESVVLDGVVKDYRRGAQVVRALDGVSFSASSGEMVAVTGPSGSGKSTLLHLIGGLDSATHGTVRVTGLELSQLGDEALTAFRRDQVGFVFQFFNLLPTLRAWENVAVPGMLAGSRLGALRGRAVTLLEQVGLGDRAEHRPAQLSGGELQRVALVRALFNDPALILADEPTGNLDSQSGAAVLGLLAGLCRSAGRTVVLVTHDRSAAELADRAIHLQDGRVVEVRAASEVAGAGP
jgi:putative ABC transport system ATP-binding protein